MSTQTTESARILVVDDDVGVLSFVTDALVQMGISVEQASRGALAIESIEKNRYDIMLLDLRMPEMDGLEVLTRVREIDESLSVIIMTGHVTLDSAVRAMKLGAEDYLLKPLEPEVLNLAVMRTMRQRRLRLEHLLLRERMASLGHTKGIIGRRLPRRSPPCTARFLSREKAAPARS